MNNFDVRIPEKLQ